MLIKTKLHVPPLRSRMVVRPRLINTLMEGKASRLILITGQAGSGKTSLVCQWVHSGNIRALWYSLDESDNEGDLFFRYLLSGLADCDSHLARVSAPLQQGLKSLTVSDMLPLFFNWAGHSTDDHYIILDDYHMITSPEIHKIISTMLHYLPPTLHFVLISRHEPPFSFSVLKVRDQILQISAQDLKFTDVEGEEFLSGTMSLTMTSDQMRNFADRAEGWVGGLQLLGLSLRHAEDQQDFANVVRAASRTTAQYLIEETINVQPERVKTFLRTTVFLNRFNADLCRSISGIKEAEEILEYLHSNNLFLVPLDTDCQWYRYHHMFSEAVTSRIRLENPHTVSVIHKDAALWFAQHGYPEDAFQHAFSSGDYEFAGDLMEDYLYLLLERYANASVQRWLAKLPYGVFMKRPLLRLDECSLKVLSHDLEDIQATIANLESREQVWDKRYDGMKKTRFLNTLAYFKYTLPYHQDPASVDVEHMKSGVREICRDENLSGATLDSTLAWSYLYQGDVKSAEKTLAQSKQEMLLTRSIFRRIMWFKAYADIERWKGHLTRSDTTLHKALSLIDQENLADTPLRFYLYLPIAWTHYLHNDLDKAREYAIMSQEYAEQAGYVTEIFSSNFLLLLLCAARKNYDDSEACIKRLTSDLHKNTSGSMKLATAYMACVYAMTNDFRSLRKWAEHRRPSPKDRFTLYLVFESLAFGRFLFFEGRYEEADRFLGAMGKKAALRGMFHAVIQIETLRSATLYAMGKSAQAIASLSQNLALAETERYVRPFVDCSALVPTLFLEASKDVTSSLLEEVLRTSGSDMSLKSGRLRLTPQSPPVLTPREVEILALIAAGYKKREIAGRTFVSPDTVKTHTRHIFEKLDVRTKAEAILRARQSGMLK